MAASVAHIWRFPVKSHGSEALEAVTLLAGQTMPWDRTWAVAHDAAKSDGSAWAPCANYSRTSKAPGLAPIKAQLDEATELVTFSHPKMPTITLHPERDAEALIAWAKPLMPEGRAASATVQRVPNRGMTDTDYPSISFASLSSLRALGQKLDQELNPLRFRGNIWFSGLGQWQEFEWVGHTLRIGTAEIKISEPIVRCLATTSNPDTGIRDADTLGALSQGWGHQDFGVYGQVITSGEIRIGDSFEVLQ